MSDLDAVFREFPPRYLHRPWRESDGVPAEDVNAAERRVGHPMPGSLRALYRTIGACDELLNSHNVFVPVERLAVDGGHLVFADENQDVVSWGFPVEVLGSEDPEVWQRVNDGGEEPPWYSEEKALADFLGEMFDWIRADEAN
ncbi:hypothetical protein F0L68_01135 [Solihabitans fulvus]|uniref:Knr4/Smi1-like domain-containing protein n=1 Tax=Solihabitans fulvus TaxID=1892852 RepID=A0A5B2XW98_9PSEU|nr:hypothetical protein [Solihabitans fulvus]KAA2267162.1 hypothetical protein F0L68_01135 [Solihabitans fulvus]